MADNKQNKSYTAPCVIKYTKVSRKYRKGFVDPYEELRKSLGTPGTVAEHMMGLIWKCPNTWCKSRNIHNSPKMPGEPFSVEKDMYGNQRCCDKCGMNYTLGPPSVEVLEERSKH